MPTHDEVDANDEMRHELVALVADVDAYAMTSDEFRDRLEVIHERHLGADADSPKTLAASSKALAAFDRLTDSIERHHQLEQLQLALGLAPEPH